MTSKQATAAMTIFCLLAGFLLGSCAIPRIVDVQPEPLPTMQTRGSANPDGITHFNNLSTTDLTVTGEASLAQLTVTGPAILDDKEVTLSANATITPTASIYHVSSTKAVTLTLAACSSNGQLLYLFGDDNNTVTIADSNVRTTTGSALSLGQYDLAVFVCFDTEWIELALATDS